MNTDTDSTTADFSRRYAPGEQVLHQELEGEAVLLNLENESYFGLDPVGTRAWSLLLEHGSLEAVFERMRDEYEIDEETLKRDLSKLVTQLLEHGLLRPSSE